MLRLLCLSLLLLSEITTAQVPFPAGPQPTRVYSDEDKNWEVEPTTTIRRSNFHAPTPTTIPGGRVIKTDELKALLDSNTQAIVVDVLDSKTRTTIPGAHWMSGAGSGALYGAEKARFATALEKLSTGDKTRPLVFLCLGSKCWLSYNASLHAIETGYKDVIWYRGGTDAWTEAKQNVRRADPFGW